MLLGGRSRGGIGLADGRGFLRDSGVRVCSIRSLGYPRDSFGFLRDSFGFGVFRGRWGGYRLAESASGDEGVQPSA